jgi:hypothetical protein
MRSIHEGGPAEQAVVLDDIDLTFAARVIANRYGVPLRRAVLIAELAGFTAQLESVAIPSRGA